MRTERSFQELKAQFEARLTARIEAAIERAKGQRDHIESLQSEIAHLRDELRQAHMREAEAVNASFAAAKMTPPHQGPRRERGPMQPVTQTPTMRDTLQKWEEIEATPPKTEDAS